MNGSGYLPPFPFQGLGAAGPEVGRRFSAFWVVGKAVFLCLHARVRILVFFSFWEQRDEWLKGGVLCFRVTFVLSFARLLEAVLFSLIFWLGGFLFLHVGSRVCPVLIEE